LFTLLLTWIYPLWIAPIFNKFTPLKDDEFRGRVEALLEKAGIRSREVLVMDAGKRSAHTNAYFTGLGRSKRVVFFDTLLEKYEPDQCLAVLAHEAGHWKHRDVLKNFVRGQVLSLLIFALAGWLVWNEPLYQAFGFETVTLYAGLFLVSLVSSPVMFFLKPFQSALSRRAEFASDRFAGRMPELGKPMRDLLIGMAVDNLSNLNPHPLYVAFHYSHPTVVERVRRLEMQGCHEESN
ncbi:MAG: M48 family metallopeptidase, partial [Planctomycetes bacterium]|nr:M48 family metallopeptidase [Planctomycetota bacterium]